MPRPRPDRKRRSAPRPSWLRAGRAASLADGRASTSRTKINEGRGIAGGEEELREIVIAGDPHPALVRGEPRMIWSSEGQLGEVKQVRSSRQALQLSNIFFNLVI